jgi:hypothetical protein
MGGWVGGVDVDGSRGLGANEGKEGSKDRQLKESVHYQTQPTRL